MTFERLIKDPFFDLPIKQSYDKCFYDFMLELLQSFLSKVEELDNEKITLNDFDTSGEFIKITQKIIVNGLLDSIKEYLNGYPHKAYERLNNLFKNEIKNLYNVIRKTTYYPNNNNFYRIRVKDEKDGFEFTPLDLFHIPFSMRGRVSSQRFSIPGFPSLYMSRKLFVCWEELDRPNIDKFYAVRLKNVKKIELLDLSRPSEDAPSWQKYLYFMTWPLIACCSVKVKDNSDIFKPEYIIPQLLLQWIRANDEIDGIIYKSTHLDSYLYNESNELYNVVLPVKEISSDKHCNKLKNIFEMTDVVSSQKYVAAAIKLSPRTYSQEMKSNKQTDLEHIKDYKNPNNISIFEELECFLNSMTTNPIQ